MGQDHIFRRSQSQNWSVRLRDANGRRYIQSLGTADKREAEIAASSLIAEHKARLLAARPHLQTIRKLEPGLHDGPNGGRIAATLTELTHYDASGKLLRTEPNATLAIVPPYPQSSATAVVRFVNSLDNPERPTVAVKTSDDMLFQTYIDSGARKGRGLSGYARKEAQATWDLFRTLTEGKALEKCTRDDGRKLIAHWSAEGLSYPSMQKKVMWLSAMVEFSIAENKLSMVNPFSGIVPQRTPQEKHDAKRVPLDDADLKACKSKLGTLSKSDQLLFRLLEGTGMRLSEAFQIKREEAHNGGPRFVIVGNKTENSLRRVPLPKSVLPYLPATIKQPLFEGLPSSASHRFTEFLRDTVKITDPKKVLYSLRHRAKDRLRDLECPEKISEALFGRDEVTTGDDYGKGFAIKKLKVWVDKISTLHHFASR